MRLFIYGLSLKRMKIAVPIAMDVNALRNALRLAHAAPFMGPGLVVEYLARLVLAMAAVVFQEFDFHFPHTATKVRPL